MISARSPRGRQSIVLCVGSLTRLAESALRFVQSVNGRLNQHPFQSDYGDAQNLLRAFLEIITSPDVQCNVVLECHIESIDDGSGAQQDFPRAIGKALSPIIGSYFNNLLEIKKVGQRGDAEAGSQDDTDRDPGGKEHRAVSGRP